MRRNVLQKAAQSCIVCAIVVLAARSVYAQTADLRGTVKNAATGAPLSAAGVFVVGANLGANANLDGFYVIKNVPQGVYDVRVTAEGYTTQVVPRVALKAGETRTLDVALEAKIGEAYTIEDVIVSAGRALSSDFGVLSARQQAITIGDGISAEQISKSPDATSGDALKRITGLSVVDNKYVFVRGVTDRYNSTSLNGVSVTSTDTDVDKKSFTFDLVPASLLENTVVVKTATPDLPGDFSGGLVQVNTLDFPPNRLIKFSFASAYNTMTSTRDVFTSRGGNKDWLAEDDGSRALPPGDLKGNSLARVLPNDWVPRTLRAPLNGTYNLALGDRFAARGQELGFVGALIYKDSYQKLEFTESPSYLGVKFFDFDGTRYQRSVVLGGLLNLNYKPSPRHELSFKNNYIRTALDKVSTATGLPNSGEWQWNQAITWDQRSLYLNQAEGKHTLGFLRDLDVRWKVYTSKSEAAEPDRKYIALERYEKYLAFKENYRTWSDLSENSRGWDGDLTLPVGGAKLKAGLHHERRERTFTIDAYATDASNVQSPNYGLLILPVGKMFLPENYGKKKFTFVPVTPFTGEYDGAHEIEAYYCMADVPFAVVGRDFRLAGGARAEHSN
ncbi:MAG TPA: carboxypeptidase regulatory-like domain-containing protein, partial [Candidatus Bathyarchaeia archaeon]|nr:carboxypeptidase regulatory-like domain-containing protein [Candidatus Bathyarchaeia archaeon]